MKKESQSARLETIRYHEDYYGSNKLYEEGSWLSEPDYEIEKLIEHLLNVDEPRILDLGAGVGRNAIYLAQKLDSNNPTIDCYDLLESAINQLKNYSIQYKVEKHINAYAQDMDNLSLEKNIYDGIMSISVLEHSQSYDTMTNTIKKLISATKSGGIHRLTFSTNRTVTSIKTGLAIESLVETPLERDSIVELLKEIYNDWSIEELSCIDYDENLERLGEEVNWKSSDLSFIALKK